MFRRTAGKSSSVWSRGLPRYRNFITFYNLSNNSTPSRLNSISPHISDISTSLRQSLIYVALLHLSICMCLKSLASGMCIPHWSHHGNGSGPSCMMATFTFQCRYMKCSLIFPGVLALARHSYTRNSINSIIRRKDTLYISGPPPPKYTSLPEALLYHVTSTYGVKGKKRPLSPCTPHNLPCFSSFSERWVPPPYLSVCIPQLPAEPK